MAYKKRQYILVIIYAN